MKITVTDQKAILKSHVAVRLSEEVKQSRFVIEGKKEVLEIKAPKAKDMNQRKWNLLVRSIILEAQKNKLKKIVLKWKDLVAFDDLGDHCEQQFAENALMAAYQFRTYKKKPKEGWDDIEEIVIVAGLNDLASVRRGIHKGKIIAQQINFCRDLANTPGGDMTPEILVRETAKVVRGTGVRMTVLDEAKMRTKKMGGVLAVGQGSAAKSQFIILEYKGATNKKAKPIVLVGKGVTFDTGGIDTKPHPYGLEMMMDMSGGAAVISAIIAAAKLKLKKNIIVLVPAVENMPGGSAFRPGDIVRMMDGTTVEVGHTDAEGRLILADALTFAKQYDPKTVIDVATLTGAAMVALGERASAIFTDDDNLAQKVTELGEEAGDYVWRLPLWEEYSVEIAGSHGDISNIRTKGQPRYGGAITAAAFLKHFAKNQKFKSWMHIDMAPMMTASFDENLAKGAKGTPVRLLVRLLEK